MAAGAVARGVRPPDAGSKQDCDQGLKSLSPRNHRAPSGRGEIAPSVSLRSTAPPSATGERALRAEKDAALATRHRDGAALSSGTSRQGELGRGRRPIGRMGRIGPMGRRGRWSGVVACWLPRACQTLARLATSAGPFHGPKRRPRRPLTGCFASTSPRSRQRGEGAENRTPHPLAALGTSPRRRGEGAGKSFMAPRRSPSSS